MAFVHISSHVYVHQCIRWRKREGVLGKKKERREKERKRGKREKYKYDRWYDLIVREIEKKLGYQVDV